MSFWWVVLIAWVALNVGFVLGLLWKTYVRFEVKE